MEITMKMLPAFQVHGKSELLFLPQAESKAATTHAIFFVTIQVRKLIKCHREPRRRPCFFFYFFTPEEFTLSFYNIGTQVKSKIPIN